MAGPPPLTNLAVNLVPRPPDLLAQEPPQRTEMVVEVLAVPPVGPTHALLGRQIVQIAWTTAFARAMPAEARALNDHLVHIGAHGGLPRGSRR